MHKTSHFHGLNIQRLGFKQQIKWLELLWKKKI